MVVDLVVLINSSLENNFRFRNVSKNVERIRENLKWMFLLKTKSLKSVFFTNSCNIILFDYLTNYLHSLTRLFILCYWHRKKSPFLRVIQIYNVICGPKSSLLETEKPVCLPQQVEINFFLFEQVLKNENRALPSIYDVTNSEPVLFICFF